MPPTHSSGNRPTRAKRSKHPDYDVNVFINCPFDEAYEPLFRAMVFTIYECGFVPRCAKGRSNQNRRFERIVELIGESRYGIHDLSRMELGKLPRNNMPLELGVFIGCWHFGTTYDYQKEYLILDKEAHRYNQHTSDLKADDIAYHEDQPHLVIEGVRDWLADRPFRVDEQDIASADIVVERYERFLLEAPALAAAKSRTFSKLKFSEYCEVVIGWLQKQRQEYAKFQAKTTLGKSPHSN